MLGATRLTSIFGSGVDNTNHDAVRSFIRAACGQGLSLLLIQPGTKVPADMRTPRQRSAANRAAQGDARDAGRPDWARVKAPSGLALASTNAAVVLKYLDRYIETHGPDVAVNLAVEVGGSRLVVVDCDTRAQYENFLAVTEAPADLPPTVFTPGQLGPDGTMIHSDGGHFYFTVPDGVELPVSPGSLTWGTGPDAFAVLWNRRYVLIPPSTRPEGSYTLAGRDYPLPTDIRKAITERGEGRAHARANARPDDDPDSLTAAIDAWAQSVSWASILEPMGWTPTARTDNCGCDVWTAPGDHASPKSATTHDSGCQLGRYTETNAPLHIWTDHPGEPFEDYIAEYGTHTMSKLQAVSLTEYNGNIAEAMEQLDVLPPPNTIAAELGLDASHITDDAEVDTAHLSEDISEDISTETVFTDTDAEPEDGVFEPVNRGVPRIAPFSHWRDMPPPEFVIEGLIEHGGLSSLIGYSGVGKTTVALDWACHIATGRTWQNLTVLKTRVLYLPGEGLSGAVQRIEAWSQAHDIDLGDDLLLGDSILQLAAHRDAWTELATFISAHQIGLVIFDTFARMTLGIEENSATDVGKAVARFDQLRRLTNAGVMVVHHTSKGTPNSGRGSNALNGALDSEILVRIGWSFREDDAMPDADEIPTGKQIEMLATKQKNAEQNDVPLHLLVRNYEPVGAPIITTMSGQWGSGDPMNAITLARAVEEPLVETAIRIRAFVDRFTEQGVTRSEICSGVTPDPYTAARKDSARHWKLKVAEATDRALHWELIETLTGTASGSRYIPGIAGADRARSQAAHDIITDILD